MVTGQRRSLFDSVTVGFLGRSTEGGRGQRKWYRSRGIGQWHDVIEGLSGVHIFQFVGIGYHVRLFNHTDDEVHVCNKVHRLYFSIVTLSAASASPLAL